MPERLFASPSDATTPMTLESSPFASSADIPSGPAAGYFLPGNPLPYLAPSATHQPELLLISWMFATLNTIVTDIQTHWSPTLFPILLLSPTSKPTGSTYSFATIFVVWEQSTQTCAAASASSNFCLVPQARRVTIAWTHPPSSHHQPHATIFPHHPCSL